MAAPKYSARWPVDARLWDACETRANRTGEVAGVAKRLFSNKARYVNIEKKTKVPWWVIAALHERESGGRFDRQLAQGDPLNRRSTNEPISGPFATFEDSAVWALHHDGLDKVIDWRIEKALYYAEGYNGWGYAMYHPNTPSPYIWGASTVQKPGKYVADGVWSSTKMDEQVGVAVMWKALADFDKTIKFVRETPLGIGTPGQTAPVPVNQVDTSTTVKVEPKKNWWSWLTGK